MADKRSLKDIKDPKARRKAFEQRISVDMMKFRHFRGIGDGVRNFCPKCNSVVNIVTERKGKWYCKCGSEVKSVKK